MDYRLFKITIGKVRIKFGNTIVCYVCHPMCQNSEISSLFGTLGGIRNLRLGSGKSGIIFTAMKVGASIAKHVVTHDQKFKRKGRLFTPTALTQGSKYGPLNPVWAKMCKKYSLFRLRC